MSVKKIPPVNIVLFFIMLGVVSAATVGVVKFVKSEDDLRNNYIESTYNASLSKYYTDSLSRTEIAALGKIEVLIYDSVENMATPYALCRISNDQNVTLTNELKYAALVTFLTVFPQESWNGEFNYRIRQTRKWKSLTIPFHNPQSETETELSLGQ